MKTNRSRERTDMGHEPVQVLLQHPVVVQAEVVHERLRLLNYISTWINTSTQV